MVAGVAGELTTHAPLTAGTGTRPDIEHALIQHLLTEVRTAMGAAPTLSHAQAQAITVRVSIRFYLC